MALLPAAEVAPVLGDADSAPVSGVGRLRLNAQLVVGAVLVVIVVCLAVFAPLFTHWNPSAQELTARLKSPSWDFSRSGHPLGTDQFGRDELAQLLYGARYSLGVAGVATILSGIVGVALALVAGYGNRWGQTIVMRLVDAMQSLPAILVGLLVVALHGNSLTVLTLVLALTGWPTYTRILFGVVERVRHQEYISASVVVGMRPMSIVGKHVLPNILSPIIVITTLQMGRMMLLEAGLSFLGLGIPVSLPAWGTMLAGGQRNIFDASYLSTIPGLAITFVVGSINILGDGLRKALDPRS